MKHVHKFVALFGAIPLLLAALEGTPASAGWVAPSAVAILRDAATKQVQVQADRSNWIIARLNVTGSDRSATVATMSVLFKVTMLTRLKPARAVNSPIVQGQRAFLRERGASLSAAQRAAVQQRIDFWNSQLREYTVSPSPAEETLKVTAVRGIDGNPLAESVQVFYRTIEDVDVPMSTALASIPTDTTLRAQAFAGAAATADTVAVKIPGLGSLLANSPVSDEYQRSLAVNYANKFSSNTALPCKSGSTVKQDPRKYNAAYKHYECNDCANFVSQALHTGTIPKDSTWKPYTSAWISVSGLKSYMTSSSHHYWFSAPNASSLVVGDTITLTNVSHVIMVTYTDGTRRISAHTTDHSNYIDYNGSEAFWNVHRWVATS